MKKTTRTAFTLAEIMIVLTVIGILTAIILPSARNLMPDKNLMKFKKAHNTLLTAITELVNSDKYYLDGDLGIKADGTILYNSVQENWTYFCQTLGDVLNTKQLNCKEISQNSGGFNMVGVFGTSPEKFVPTKLEEGQEILKLENVDKICREAAPSVGEEIVLPDGVVIFETRSATTFGMGTYDENGEWYRTFFSLIDENNFPQVYKAICIDIDGIPENATESDCVNECPFGYGVRHDGKIVVGIHAREWLEKDISQN